MTDISDDSFQSVEDSDSGFVTDSDSGIGIDVGSLMSAKYSNIITLHGSESAPFRLSSAIRYGKRYVLKSINSKFTNDSLYQVLLAKEFELGINVDHPNIRRTIAFEHIDGIGNAIVLEYVDGETLDEAMMKSHLKPEQVRPIVVQIADALDYLHCRQILHRDIKPANIMLTYSGQRVKLIDFSHSDSESFVILKTAAGTNKYIAPELLDGVAQPSVKSDIYSFGVIVKALARISDDSELMRVAKRCSDPNPDVRPDSFSGILRQSSGWRIVDSIRSFLESRILTYILVFLLILIWSFIIISLI